MINSEKIPRLILISGTPGTGKTTIAKILCKKYKIFHFQLGDYIIANELYEKTDDSRDTKIVDIEYVSIKIVLEILKIIINEQKTHNYEYILLDSHYSDCVIDGIDQVLEKPNLITDNIYLDEKGFQSGDLIDILKDYNNNEENIIAIILRCSPYELETRLIKRKYSNLKIMENIQAEILGESTQNMLDVLNTDNIFEIITSKNDISKTIEIIESILFYRNTIDHEKYFGNIDWLRMLIKDDKLKLYFNEEIGEKKILDLNDYEI